MIRRLLQDESGAAGAELVLIMPLLIILLFSGLETGHLFWTQHKIVKGVRDGARFAARQPIAKLNCGAKDPTTETNIKRLTRTGQITSASAPPKVNGWTDTGVTVSVACSTTTTGGIYNSLAGGAPVITVAASVTYPTLLDWLDLFNTNISLTAQSTSALTGL